MLVLIAGFALFFIALGQQLTSSMLWVLHAGVLGQDPQGEHSEFEPLSQRVKQMKARPGKRAADGR